MTAPPENDSSSGPPSEAPDPTTFAADRPPIHDQPTERRRDWLENVGRSRRSHLTLDLALLGLSLAASGLAVWLLGRFGGWWH